MEHSIFAMELCLPLDEPLRGRLHALIQGHPAQASPLAKSALYREATDALLGHLSTVERGCWDFFNDDARALRDYEMWSQGMITEEGARTSPSGARDPYRDEPRYMTFTMAFLLVQGTQTNQAMFDLCNISEATLWIRDSFERILRGMRVMDFAAVKSDVVYLIPGHDEWGLTREDLATKKFEYLRAIE
ncbi:MAG: hypothetical protein NVSMB47_00980 [Polyangiales bacterium]